MEDVMSTQDCGCRVMSKTIHENTVAVSTGGACQVLLNEPVERLVILPCLAHQKVIRLLPQKK
jgi:hypothetical protein